MNNRLVRFTKGLLDVMFYLGIVVTVGIPVIFYYVGRYIEAFHKFYLAQCALYMLSGEGCFVSKLCLNLEKCL